MWTLSTLIELLLLTKSQAFLRYAEYFTGKCSYGPRNAESLHRLALDRSDSTHFITGIIILTTNLGRTIDPAVISRAHIHITFPAFTKTMRIQVWQKSVERLSGDVGTLDETAIDHLASWKINGREIKNILNLSMTWCRKEKRQLSIGVVGNPITTICPGARKEDGTQIGTGEAMLNGSTIDEFSLLDI